MCRADRLQLPPNIEISRHPRPRRAHDFLTPQLVAPRAPNRAAACCWLSGAMVIRCLVIRCQVHSNHAGVRCQVHSNHAVVWGQVQFNRCPNNPIELWRAPQQNAGESSLARRNMRANCIWPPRTRWLECTWHLRTAWLECTWHLITARLECTWPRPTGACPRYESIAAAGSGRLHQFAQTTPPGHLQPAVRRRSCVRRRCRNQAVS